MWLTDSISRPTSSPRVTGIGSPRRPPTTSMARSASARKSLASRVKKSSTMAPNTTRPAPVIAMSDSVISSYFER